jgi:hypothetical protein
MLGRRLHMPKLHLGSLRRRERRTPKAKGELVIATRQELLQAIIKTLERATPEEKRQIRDALLESLCGNRCGVCGRRRMTLLLNTVSGTLQCFQCSGKDGAQPVWVREPGDLSREDWNFLRSVGVLWGDDVEARKENKEEE